MAGGLGLGLAAGRGAGGVADALQELFVRRMTEASLRQRQLEAEQQHTLATRGAGLAERRQTFDENQFAVEAPHRAAVLENLGAQTGHIKTLDTRADQQQRMIDQLMNLLQGRGGEGAGGEGPAVPQRIDPQNPAVRMLFDAAGLSPTASLGPIRRSKEDIVAETTAAEEAREPFRIKRDQRTADRMARFPIQIQTRDPDTGEGITRVGPRGTMSGQDFPLPPTGSQRTQMGETEAALDRVEDVRRLFKPGLVGPLEGRFNSVRENLPGVPVNRDASALKSAVAGLKNRVIKAITGAQMSEPEARRIQGELPDITQKPEVFELRLRQTEKNYADLLAILQRKGKGAGAGAGAGAGTGKSKILKVEEIPE